jgi:broad specificity phosphatase PhoE
MTQTTIYLVRHAHTQANEEGSSPALAGWSDFPISERGEIQLAALRERFDTRGAELTIYSSDLPRALTTARAISRGRRVVPLRSLREICCGTVDGLPLAGVQLQYPDVWRRNIEQVDESFAWPGGETYTEFRRRVLLAINGIAARHAGARVLIVTHAGVISQIAGALHGVSAARWSEWRPGNCSVTTVAWGPAPGLLEFDSREHLDPVNAQPARQLGG